jgi:hypothetical protein
VIEAIHAFIEDHSTAILWVGSFAMCFIGFILMAFDENENDHLN